MAKTVIKESDFGTVKVIDSHKRFTLNFTDIINNNNKFYNLEILETDKGFVLYTNYGRVGGTVVKEYRVCSSKFDAESEAKKIIKSKIKKGYVEVKLVQAAIGSDLAKSNVETSLVSADDLKKIGIKVEDQSAPSKLHPQVADLIRTWFSVTAEFVEINLDTKKCPLGQLSTDSIIKGRDILEEARNIIHSSKPDVSELNRLTNMYYSNIPHNFGYTRINADVLRLNTDDKIDKAFEILDVFSNAKDVEKVISKKNNVDSQYDTLNAQLQFVDPSDPTWKWIDTMVHRTRAANHHFLGNLNTHKVFRISRNDEEKLMLTTAEDIARVCGKSQPSKVYASLVKERPDVPKELRDLYAKANILPGWHGTRRANMIGITTKGLLIRPSGVVHAGSMYGDGIYWATQSTKSMNYCDVRGSYWAQGSNKTAYLFWRMWLSVIISMQMAPTFILRIRFIHIIVYSLLVVSLVFSMMRSLLIRLLELVNNTVCDTSLNSRLKLSKLALDVLSCFYSP
jgi:poly [ADP-ribose] polymerase